VVSFGISILRVISSAVAFARHDYGRRKTVWIGGHLFLLLLPHTSIHLSSQN